MSDPSTKPGVDEASSAEESDAELDAAVLEGEGGSSGGDGAAAAATVDPAARAADLQRQMGHLCATWGAPRTGAGLAAAVWRPDMGAFEVAVANGQGQKLASMGFTHGPGGRQFLHIEEALQLADRGNMLLFTTAGPTTSGQRGRSVSGQARRRAAPKRLMSLEEAFDSLVGLGIGLDRYRVYSELAQLGFIVRRHPARWHLAATEHPAEVWGAQAAWHGTDGLPPSACPRQSAQPHGKTQRGRASSARGEPQGSSKQPRSQQQKQQQPQQQQQSQRTRCWWPQQIPWMPEGHTHCTHKIPPAPDVGALLQQQFPRLQPLPRIDSRGAAAQLGSAEAGSFVVFDVYGSTKASFARTAPGPPAFHVGMQRDGGACAGLPPLPDLLALTKEAGPLPLRLAVLQGGAPCLYGVQRGALLNLLGS